MYSGRQPWLAAVAVLLGVSLAACGSSSEPSIPVSGQLVGQSATSPGHIVLSALGAQRIGVRTAVARPVPTPPPVVTTTIVHGVKTTTSSPARAPAARVIIPYSAVIYDPSGKTYAFTTTAPLTFVEVPITVDHISGGEAFLARGPKPGAKVVAVGAEELYGVQTGVLAQT